MSSGKSDLVDVDVDIIVETPKAFGIASGKKDEFEKEILVWVPKSQAEKNEDGSITLPEWLAVDKGLV